MYRFAHENTSAKNDIEDLNFMHKCASEQLGAVEALILAMNFLIE
jgi:hypothetical protein